jgi:hypothetical protein
MSKRDRQGVRTPAGLEQKYDLGNKFKSQSKTNMTTAERIVYLDRSMTDNQAKFNASVESLMNEDASIKETFKALSEETAASLKGVEKQIDVIEQTFGTINDELNRINQNIGTMNAFADKLDKGKVNKSDVVNNLSTTASGKVADARTVKALNDKFKIVRRVFTVTLSENAYCKPFSYFGSFDITSDIHTYGFPIGVYLYTTASVPMPCYFSDGFVRMASGEASNTLVIDYLNGGFQ